MIAVYIVFALFLVFGSLSVFIIITIDNINEYAIRLNEAEANIDSTLKKRFDLLNKSIDIIHNTLAKDGDILNSIVELRSQKLNNFELDKALYKGIEEFNEYSLDNPILKNNEDYTKIEINLIESEAEIISLKKYYNDIVTKYNAITTKFPTSLVAKAKHYASKNLFIIEDHLELINSLKEQATPIKNN